MRKQPRKEWGANMSKDLRQFLQKVRKEGDEFYVEASRPLKPKYEVCAIQQKLANDGRFPVVYCPEIEGSKLPLVSNLFSNYEMLGLALDITSQKLKTVGKAIIFQEYRRRQSRGISPKEIPASQAPVREIILQGKDVDLGLLPVNHHSELNSGKYISIGMTVCKDPDTGIPNVGIYRHELKGKDKLGCMVVMPHHGAYIAQRYAELGKPMQVVIFIGHHPALAMGATADGPLQMNEFEVMGALLGEPIEVVPAITVDLPVPARAEIAIEGVIDTTKMDKDGPFCELYGYYGEQLPCYVIQVTAMTMRRDAIYHDLYPAHQEHNLVVQLGRESRIYDEIQSKVPTIKAIHYGPEGQCGKALAYISMKKGASDEGKQAGLTALEADLGLRIATIVDDDIDVYDEREVLWAVGTRLRGDSGISILPGMPTWSLNPCAYDRSGVNLGSHDTKIIIDATKLLGMPFAKRVSPPKEFWDSMNLENYLK
jgi:2,5-furandicarboxylate decarboxylase 1